MLIRVGNTTIHYPGVGLVGIGSGSTGGGGSGGGGSGGGAGTVQPLTLIARATQIAASDQGVTALWCLASGGIGPYTYGFVQNGSFSQGLGFNGYYYYFNNQVGGVASFNYNGTAPVAGSTDTLEVSVRDGNGSTATTTVSITYLPANPTLIRFGPDYLMTNVANPSTQAIQVNVLLGPGFTSAATITTNDPSGYFNVTCTAANGGYISPKSSSTWPPAGTYPITFTMTQGGNTYTNVINVYVIAETGTGFIVWAPVPAISTSLPAGFIIGQATCGGDPDNTYAWTVSPSSMFAVSGSGVVTLTSTPSTPGAYPMTLTVADGDQSTSSTVSIAFVQGNIIASSAMTATIPQGLTNAVSSGVLTTPSVTGFTPTQWVLAGLYGVGTRYSILTNGQVNIIGALSFQEAADGTNFDDVLTIIATDGINTCTKTVTVPVAAAVGPTIFIGPPAVLAAAGVTGTQYATLTAAFTALGGVFGGSSTTQAGTTFQVYPAATRDYYVNDGINLEASNDGCGGQITQFVPITIQGAPGQTFPYFTGNSAGKGLFGGTTFDLTIRNLEIGNATGGQYGNVCGIYKESGNSSGNLTVDNCYIHDCDDGIARGCAGSKVFVTNTRVSHCGAGNLGYTHNFYVLGDLIYANNVLSDTVIDGHLFKCRALNSIIKNTRLIDGNLGSASNILDLPFGGLSIVQDVLLHKGPNGQNNYMLKYADPGDINGDVAGTGLHNTLTVTGCTFLLDPGEPGLGLIMPGMTTSNAAQTQVCGIVNSSYPGEADGLPAVVNASDNSFYGLLENNQAVVINTNAAQTGTIPAGTNNVTGSVVLTTAQRPALDYSFPGPGPDPTIANPPGPFLQTWLGGVGGGQITGPANIMSLPIGTAPGGVAGTITWSKGNTAIATPAFSLVYQSGPNAWVINSSTGAITNTATVVAQSSQLDVVGIRIDGGGQTYLWSMAIKAA